MTTISRAPGEPAITGEEIVTLLAWIGTLGLVNLEALRDDYDRGREPGATGPCGDRPARQAPDLDTVTGRRDPDDLDRE